MPGTPRHFDGDPVRVRQVITNLVGNAVKFTSEGHVLIRVSEAEGGLIHVAVEDTGIGIPTHAVDRIFEKFEQADVSTTRKHGGTGLGLAISRELSELMGGRVDVTSVEGEGSVFSSYLALRRGSDPTDDHLSDVAKGARFVVVSPSNLIRTLVRQDLEGYGATVRDAACVDGALCVIGSNQDAVAKAYLVDSALGEDECRRFAQRVPAASGGGDPVVVRMTPGHLADRNAEDSPYAFDLPKPLIERRWLELLRRLELLKDACQDERKAEDEAAMLATMKVLLVEDNAVNRIIAIKLLEQMGMEVGVAVDGQEAVDAFDSESYDLVLMDCQMPVMDGFDATVAIREREVERGGHVPILALTASAMEADKERCLSVGMDSFLAKPFTIHQLRAAIAAQLGSRA
jgi:CheY-like chemotaxis protein/anti-sigma regulatory factor (Ser/Thr protein kinase)